MYKPPFSITNEMLKKSISITEKISKIEAYESLERMPILRRNNKIKSIHSSLAIEANSLSLDNVRDIISGKAVIGPKKEIQEVINAYKTYEKINEFDAYSESDLLKAHKMLMESIEKESGVYRKHAEGVLSGSDVIFIAPPHELVPQLMKDLFEWLKNDNDVPLLIKSCIFHYEFVFIHPFSDGNGRIARLWQNVLLIKWNPIFEYIPIESRINQFQNDYYNSIAKCHENGNSNEFIETMLEMIDDALEEAIKVVKRESMNISYQVNKLLEVMDNDIPISANELMKRLNIKTKETLRASYINPAIKNGLIRMMLPDKPNSKNQKYIK